jgi:hypothetical protein
MGQPRRTRTRADIREEYLDRMHERFWRGLNILSVFLFVLILYLACIGVDFLIIRVVEYLLAQSVGDIEFMQWAFTNTRIGLGLMSIVATLVHGAISALNQIKLDWELFKEH